MESSFQNQSEKVRDISIIAGRCILLSGSNLGSKIRDERRSIEYMEEQRNKEQVALVNKQLKLMKKEQADKEREQAASTNSNTQGVTPAVAGG